MDKIQQKQYNHQYYLKYRDKIKNNVNNWRANNKDKVNVINTRWRDNNNEQMKQIRKNWSERHPGYKIPKGERSCYQEIREAVIYFLINRDGLNCFYCNTALNSDIHISHKIAVECNGKNRLENYCLAHSNCNLRDAIRFIRESRHG